MCAKHYENSTMLSKVTAKNVGDVFLRHTVEMGRMSDYDIRRSRRFGQGHWTSAERSAELRPNVVR